MKRTAILGSLAAVIIIALALMIVPRSEVNAEEKMEMPFGGKADVKFATKMWKGMADYQKWLIKSEMLPGKSPHGKFLKLYYNIVNIDEKPYHVIIKNNYTPEKKLAAITIMVKREAGYDPDNQNWFWAKYETDGSISKNDKDMALAGRVAKGMDMGCIACHKVADDNDYVFINEAGNYGR